MIKRISTILLLMLIFPLSVSAGNLKPLGNLNNTQNIENNGNNENNQNNGKIDIIKLNVSTDNKFNDKEFLKHSWDHIKGQPSDNALNLLMFSYHTRKDRDQMNESNKLVNIDYDGYTLGTYNNSYHHQTYFAGITRKVYEKGLPAGINMDLNYKLMALYGYRHYEFNIGGVTPLIVPVIGFSKGLFGVDFIASPGKTVTFATNFRINLPENKTNQKAILLK